MRTKKRKRPVPVRSSGPSSRLPFDNEELERQGWTITRLEREDGSVVFRWRTPEGRNLKSLKEVVEYRERLDEEDETEDEEFLPNSEEDYSEQSASESPVKKQT